MNGKRIFLLLCFLILSRVLPAQLCQGSLGDPLVHITFGSGQNPGPPLQAATTSYQFSTADCPNDGFYTVRSRSDRCFGGWHSLVTDHTGDPNGYFMLVNASFDPSDFYVDTVDLACSNTTFEFAAWVANMNSPAECASNSRRPNLTFIIEKTDGTVLQSFNTGDIQPQTSISWRQFGFFFNTPSMVNRVVLKIRNNAPGGCGNDLALDDITFRPCGPQLNVSAAGGNSDINLCQGTAGRLTFTGSISSGFDNPFLQWQQSNDNGRTWTNIANANAITLVQDFPATTPVGSYLYRLSAAKMENSSVLACSVHSGALTVKVNGKPDVSAATVSSLCEGATLRLSATGATRYTWTGGNGFNANTETVSIPNVTMAQAGRYYVTGTNAQGCQDIDSVDVTVNAAPAVQVNGNEFSFCEGGSAQFVASGGDRYAWTPATGLTDANIANPVASPTDSTQYKLTVTSTEGCTDSAFVAVHVFKKPIANAGPDKEIGQGQSVVLDATASGTDVLYQWSPPVAMDDASKLRPRVAPNADQEYLLTVTSPHGCGVVTDRVQVKVYKGVFIPTAFTPNGDGKNDAWRILGLSVYPSYEVLVFNRYGQIIYRSKNATPVWNGTFNGTPVPTGSYPYLVRIGAENRVLKGTVTVVR